jgi:hypothetical protein
VILRMVSALLMLLVPPRLWALNESRLLSQSSSGQTVVFNLGIHDGVKPGDYAVIVKKIRDLSTKDLRIIPAAKARSIKVNPDSSIWVLYHVYDAELMVTGQNFLVLTESNMLRGRRQVRIGRNTLVAPKGEAGEIAKLSVTDDRDRLAKKKNKYHTITETHGREDRSDMDLELLDLEEWERAKGDRYRSALYKSPNREEFRRAYRLETFQKMVAAYLKKVNDPEFSYERFYDFQMREDFSNEFRKRSNFSTEYENFLRQQASKASADAKLYRVLLEKGETWSEDFSDEELRRVLNNVSVLQERDRKRIVLARPLRYAAILDYGVHLTNSQSGEDTYQRDSRYALELNLEAIPFLKHETLERFTLNASVRMNKSAFETTNINVDLDEYSVGFGANWYPLFNPYAIEAPVIFLGMFFRTGFARGTAPSVAQKANYTILSAPGFITGLRYNFKNNIGLRITASMETLRLERYEASRLASAFPERTDLVEGKMGLGFVYSF